MKLLVLLSRVPFPLDKGDKLRAYNFIKYLSEYHDIYLFCINEKRISENEINEIKPYCKEIKIVKLSNVQILISLIKSVFYKLPFQVAYFYNKKTHKELNTFLIDTQPDHIFCQLIRMAEYVRSNSLPKTIDYQDVFSYGVKRRLEIAPFYLKPLFNSEYLRLIKYENDIFDEFDTKIIISETDRDLITHTDKEKIQIISNGVDFNYYQPIEREKEFEIVFTGNMSYPPNIDAAQYLVNEILPLVKNQISEVKVQIAGANPSLLVKQLQSDSVSVTGWVDDMRLCYANSKVFIAPMRIGTGLQNKLLEAMAMGIPCVTTSLSNSALNAENNKEILIGNTAQELANHISTLLLHGGLRNIISTNALNFVKANFNWEENIKKLNQLISK